MYVFLILILGNIVGQLSFQTNGDGIGGPRVAGEGNDGGEKTLRLFEILKHNHPINSTKYCHVVMRNTNVLKTAFMFYFTEHDVSSKSCIDFPPYFNLSIM